MAYNPYYPYGVNPYMANGAVPDVLNQYKGQFQQNMQVQTTPQMQQMPTMSQQSNDMLWVLGEVEATSYPVAPNNTVTLWDKNNRTIYVKTVNAQGVPSMRVLDFVERSDTRENAPKSHECKCGDRFVKIDEFKELQAKFEEMSVRLESLSKTTKTKTKGKTDNG